MIFNNDIIFIHSGKTGGMSCSSFLLNNLKRPIYNCHKTAFDDIKNFGADGIIPQSEVERHCTLAEALNFINQLTNKHLTDFKKVFVVIRHPFTLEYSLYKHLQKPQVRELRKNSIQSINLANGSFKNFVENAGYHRPKHPQEAFFMLDGKIPSCVELIKFEQLAYDFPSAIEPFNKSDSDLLFPHKNKTNYESDLIPELTDEVRHLLYLKHKFMFDSGLYSHNNFL